MANGLAQQAFEGFGWGQRLELSVELELALGVELLQSGAKLAAKHRGEGAHGEEEMRRGAHPLGAVGGQPAARDDAVQVIMVQQRLAPGVQHGGDAQLGLEAVPAKLQQGLAGGAEQQGVEGALVLLDQRVERVRQREHQVEIRHRQERRLLFGQPVSGRLPLAQRAVPVAAGMRHKMRAATLQAPVAMAAQCRGAASQQRVENAPMMPGQGWREPLRPARNTAAKLSPATGAGGWPQFMSAAGG